MNNSDQLKKLSTIFFLQNGHEAKKFQLQKVNDKLYRTQLIRIPQGSFKVTIEGIDSSNNKIYRMLSNAVVAGKIHFEM